MRCPKCNGRLVVKDSRKLNGEVLRMRQCLTCRKKVYTYECIDDTGYACRKLNEFHRMEQNRKNLLKKYSGKDAEDAPVGVCKS